MVHPESNPISSVTNHHSGSHNLFLLYFSEFVYVAVCLTREPLFKRNLTSFGPTNLRATICYNMVRLASPQAGEVVVDPMCGGATIPMEVME